MKTLHHISYTNILFFNHLFFFFPWLFNAPSNPKLDKYCSLHFQIFLSIYRNIYSCQETQMQSKFAHKKGSILSDTPDYFKTLKHSHDIRAVSAPPMSLSFCHCCVYTSNFALRKPVALETFAQNLLTELFYFLEVWAKQKGQGQYVQSMYFLGFFVHKKSKMLFLFFC